MTDRGGNCTIRWAIHRFAAHLDGNRRAHVVLCTQFQSDWQPNQATFGEAWYDAVSLMHPCSGSMCHNMDSQDALGCSPSIAVDVTVTLYGQQAQLLAQ